MTLIESARMNGHDPYAYLKDVLTRLPRTNGCPPELRKVTSADVYFQITVFDSGLSRVRYLAFKRRFKREQ